MKPKRAPIRKATRTVRSRRRRTPEAATLAETAAPKRKQSRKKADKPVASKPRRSLRTRRKSLLSEPGKTSQPGNEVQTPRAPGSVPVIAGGEPVGSVSKHELPQTNAPVAETSVPSRTAAGSATTGIQNAGAVLARHAPASPPAQPPPHVTPAVESTSKQIGLPVPSILLEGDEPSPVPATGPGRKFALGPAPMTAPQETVETDLPQAYGTGRLWLVARDPHCLYAHWDLTARQQRQCNAQSVHQHLLVRLYQDHANGRPLNELHLHPESRHWFIHVDRAGATYVAELGFYPADGPWQRIALSEAVTTPAATRAEPGPVQFATMAFESRAVSWDNRDAISGPFAPHFHQSIPAPAEQPNAQAQSPIPVEMRRTGQYAFPSVSMTSAAPISTWTETQAHIVAEMSGWTIPRTEWLDSVEITKLIHGQLQREVPLGLEEMAPSSIEAAIFSPLPAPPGEVSSPFGGELPSEMQFWFNVNAELVIYGATEPDAQVTIGGRPIRLRPDGTFSYRFSLPDGTYNLPITATAAHGDSRHAHLRFHRGTSYSGQVGVHPQDPSLQTPDPRHVA